MVYFEGDMKKSLITFIYTYLIYYIFLSHVNAAVYSYVS